MKLVERCPKCGGPIETKIFKKSIGLGSIDFPLAQFCPNPDCSWYQDFTETEKAEVAPPEEVEKPPRVSKPLYSKQLAVRIAILVIAGLIIAGLALYIPQQPAPLQPASKATPTAPNQTAATQTPTVSTSQPTPRPPIQIAVSLNYQRGFSPKNYPKNDSTIMIKIGDTVVWENDGTVRVTLVGRDQNGEKIFEDRLLDFYGKFSHPFNKTGTFKFTLKEYSNFESIVVVT